MNSGGRFSSEAFRPNAATHSLNDGNGGRRQREGLRVSGFKLCPLRRGPGRIPSSAENIVELPRRNVAPLQPKEAAKFFSPESAPFSGRVFSPPFSLSTGLLWTIFPWALSENAVETFNEFPRTFAAIRRKKRCPRPFRVALSQEAKPAPRLDNIRESALGGNRHFRVAAWDALKCRNPSWPIPERL